MNTIALSVIALVALFYILRTERCKNWVINRKRLQACRKRAELQELIDKYKNQIRLVVLQSDSPKGGVTTFGMWASTRASLEPKRSSGTEKRPVRILVDALTPIGNSVNVTVAWPAKTEFREFPSTLCNQRECDMDIRLYVLDHLKSALESMEDAETMNDAQYA